VGQFEIVLKGPGEVLGRFPRARVERTPLSAAFDFRSKLSSNLVQGTKNPRPPDAGRGNWPYARRALGFNLVPRREPKRTPDYQGSYREIEIAAFSASSSS